MCTITRGRQHGYALTPRLIDLYDPERSISDSPSACRTRSAPTRRILHSIVTEGCEIDGIVENSVLSPSVRIMSAPTSNILSMPSVVVEAGASVEYAIVGENTVVHAGARVGGSPAPGEEKSITTIGPDLEIRAGFIAPVGAMISKARRFWAFMNITALSLPITPTPDCASCQHAHRGLPALLRRYRVIDFSLSAMRNAGRRSTWASSCSVTISPCSTDRAAASPGYGSCTGGLRMLPPSACPEHHRGNYAGTMEALIAVSSYIMM